MFLKDLAPPLALIQAEALERGRLPENHPKMSEVKGFIRVLKSGYNGEKTLNHHLGQIPSQRYQIFHDLRLPLGKAYFQIDALLLSSKYIINLDGKNHSGILLFEKNQLIQEAFDTKEVFENPLSQANRHKILLNYWFEKYQIPSIPIEHLVAVCKSSTEIIISPGYTEAEERVCKANDLLKKIEDIENYYKKESLDQKTINKISKLLLNKHTPQKIDILKKFEIANSEIVTGVQCPNCLFIPMNYRWNRWICPACHWASKDAHLTAINDYFLIIKSFFTNAELREFLHLPSSRSTTYLLSLLNLPHTGTTRDRVYHQPNHFL